MGPEQFAETVRALGRLAGGRPMPSIGGLDLWELEWMNCAYFFWNTGPTTAHVPPQKIGAAQPDAVCLGYTGTIRLLPVPGETFTNLGSGWVLAIDGKVVRVIQQTLDWIDVEMPAGVKGGCISAGWLLDVSATSEYLNEMRQACQRFFGGTAR